jgi:hypothetical protein
MNFDTLHQLAPSILKSRKSVELVSPPGRGKSEFIAAQPSRMSRLMSTASRKVEWGFATCFLATMTPADMMGFMVPEKREDGRLVSSFTMPPWMRTVDGRMVDEFEYGILLLDEYGQGEADTKRASAELLLNKRLGQWQLPAGWSVWAASNRASDRSGITKSFDFVINRRLEIHITDDINSWVGWAEAKGVDPVFITFARQNPQIVFDPKGVPDKQGPWCTPRSLVMCQDVLNALKNDPDDLIPATPEAAELAGGMIGAGASAQLFAMIRLAHEMPNFDDIIAKPESTRIPTKPDAQMLVCYQLAARANEKNITPMIKYVERLPKEFAVTFVSSAVQRDTSLIDTKSFSKWCTENQTLMAVIHRAKRG